MSRAFATPGGGTTLTNWAGNHIFQAAHLARPRSVVELQRLVAQSPRVRVIGSGHSFTDIADTSGTLISLADIPADIRIDSVPRVTSVTGGTTYGGLATSLEAQGWALANMASLPHICIAGSVATGTHGSGDTSASLSAAVTSLDIVGPDGTLRTVDHGDPDFPGSVVSLGALGIVSRLELSIEPTYLVRQTVYRDLPWATLAERFNDVTSAGYSVSLFTHYERDVEQVWVKTKGAAADTHHDLGIATATATMHMLKGGAPEAITEQGGKRGPWLERLPHFRMAFTPSRGDELQSEYFVHRRHALEAIEALRALAPSFRSILQVGEIRTIAQDDLWLSGSFERPTVAFHFTWLRDAVAVHRALEGIEEALLPLGARPHWGKVFLTPTEQLRAGFPRFDDFRALRERSDPDRVFCNAFLDRVIT
jgi:xylitol oxidase